MQQQTIEELQQQILALKAENEGLKAQITAMQDASSGEKTNQLEQFQKILKSIPDMVGIFNYGGVLRQFVSDESTNHTGKPIEEILNKSLISILSPENARIVYDNIQKVKTRKRPYTGQHSVETNGVKRDYEHQIIPLDENHVIIYSKDITDQVNQNKRNRDLAKLLDNILDNLPIYLFVKDVRSNLKYLYWNKAFTEMLGVPSSQVVGRTDYEIFPNISDANKFRRDDAELLAHRVPLSFEEELTTVNGEVRTVSTRKVVCKLSEDQEVIIGASMDVTNLKKIEEELQLAKQKAENNDMQKTVFLSNMGHEIRTPINAIVGFADLLPNVETPEERQQCIDVIKLNSNLLMQLISDILDLSKIEAGILEFFFNEIDLGAICSRIYEMHSPLISSEKVKFIYENKGESFHMIGDANRIMQVINNFLTNATKFTSEGEIRFGFKRTGENEVYIFVEDTGIGIPENKVQNVFDRFTKLNPGAKGTGLGLAISKTIAQKLGGKIGLSSTVGKGSRFFIAIPINPKQS